MNRARYYRLRHDLRASGWEWNGGTGFAVQTPGSLVKRGLKYGGMQRARTHDIALVASTLSTGYEGAYHGTLLEDWVGKRDNGSVAYTTRIWWQNLIRANVRQDRQVFTQQLTTY